LITEKKIKKELTSIGVSAAAAAYYAVTTEGQPWWVVGSGVGANLFVNAFASYHSLEHLDNLLKNKKFVLLATTLFFGVLLSAPYGMITYLEYQTNSRFKKVGASIIAFLGNLVINELALKQFTEIAMSLQHFFQTMLADADSELTLEKHVQHNCHLLSHVLNAQNTDGILPSEMQILDGKLESDKAITALKIIYDNAALAPKPTYTHLPYFMQFFAYFIQFTIKMGFVIAPLYSALAVACAADVSFQKDFGLNKSIGVGLGNTFLLSEDLLSITGGLALGSSVIDLVKQIILYRKIGNHISPASIVSTLFSVFIAFFSGFTAEKQLGQCHQSLMGPAMLFPHADKAANVSSAFFNAIYTKFCADDVIQYILNKKAWHVGSQSYDVLKNAISNIDPAEIAAWQSDDPETNRWIDFLKRDPKSFLQKVFERDELTEVGAMIINA